MHFITISWHRLRKEKLYALVCISSLALGIAGSLLISLYLLSELTYDHYHENHERIYRVSIDFGGSRIALSGFEIGPRLVADHPQYLDFVRLKEAPESRFEVGENSRQWEGTFLADPSLFDVFTITPLRGDPVMALQDPYSIAISETFAEFYFGDRDPIGQTVSTERFEFTVTMVFQNLPENVSLQYDALLPFSLGEIYQPDLLESFSERFFPNYSTFLLVAEEFDVASFKPISDAFFRDYMATGFGQNTGNVSDLTMSHDLQNLGDLHFGPRFIGQDGGGGGNIMNLYIFVAVVAALLLSSCINYVNLATARSASRAREIAVKKVLGAQSRDLIFQFIGESIFLVGLAFILGIILALGIIELGVVENFTGKTELSQFLLTPQSVPLLLIGWLLIGVLAGIYPALQLSKPSIMSIMNPMAMTRNRTVPLREVLVWLQMTVAIAIIASVLIMLRQSDFLLEAPLGFEKNNRLVVQLQGADVIRNRAAIMQELKQHPEILNVTETGGAIGRSLSISIMDAESETSGTQSLSMNSFNGGPDYLDTLDIALIDDEKGRMNTADGEIVPILVNETLVKGAGWSQPIGKRIQQYEVVGVVRDFHYTPLHQPIGMLFISPFNDGFLNSLPASRADVVGIDLIIATSGNEEESVRTHIRDVIDRFSDQAIIDVLSMEDIWNRSYDDESRNIGLVAIFAGLSIFISLLGMGGMAAYNNERRGKEVAIRKVLGASVANILALLSTSIIKVLALAALPAFLGAWYLSNLWLERFAYRIDPNLTPFILALIIVSVCSAIVMIAQTWRAASVSPVLGIKYE